MKIRPLVPLPDQTIAERIEQIEQALKRDPYVPYRRELEREYLELTTDPDEQQPEPIQERVDAT